MRKKVLALVSALVFWAFPQLSFALTPPPLTNTFMSGHYTTTTAVTLLATVGPYNATTRQIPLGLNAAFTAVWRSGDRVYFKFNPNTGVAVNSLANDQWFVDSTYQTCVLGAFQLQGLKAISAGSTDWSYIVLTAK